MNFRKINDIVKRHHRVEKNIWDRDEYLESQFKSNLPIKDKKPWTEYEVWGTKITFNEEFFRSDTFNTDEDGIMFVGCSLTMGVGIDNEQLVWPWIVGKHFDMKVWNLGFGGVGEGFVSWIATEWLQKLNPKAVCMLIPPPGRHHFFKPPQVSWEEWLSEEFCKGWDLGSHGVPNDGEYKNIINTDINMYERTMKDVMLVKGICSEKKIPFIVESFDRWIDYSKHGKSDYNHPGPLYHEWVSKFFINELTKELEK